MINNQQISKYRFGGKWLNAIIKIGKNASIADILHLTEGLPRKVPVKFNYKRLDTKVFKENPKPIKNETTGIYEQASKPQYYRVNENGDIVIGKKEIPLDEWGYPIESYTPKQKATIDQIQLNYENAMNRRRHDYFYNGVGRKFYGGAKAIKDPKSNSFILDAPDYYSKILHVTHFSPETLRGGLRTIDIAAISEYPVMFTVTDDLAPMLQKRGFIDVLQIPQTFGGEIVNKHVLLNKGCLNNREALLQELENNGLPVELGQQIISKLQKAPDIKVKDKFMPENKQYYTDSPIHSFNILELIKKK